MPTGLPTITAQRPAKWWVTSRILAVNVLALALAAAELQLGLLRPVLGADLYVWLAFLLPVVNAALRANTSCPLTLRRPERAADASAAQAAPTTGAKAQP